MSSCALKNPVISFSAVLPLRRHSEKKRRVDDIYPQIFDAILEQHIAPTSRFTEESLGHTFGVSRGIIREVLARLSHQQVIILRRNHRPQVAAPNAEQTRQILHARKLTETTLVRLACQRATSRDLQQLRELINRARHCIEQNQRGAAIRLSGEFHLQLAHVASNAPLAQFLGSLVPLISLAIARDQEPLCSDCAWQAHAAIVEALECGNAKIAVGLMSRHLDHLEEKLLGS
jgi:DNA-binding GntR family transcriptional regulator